MLNVVAPALDEACTESFKAIGCVEDDKRLREALQRIKNIEMYERRKRSDHAEFLLGVPCKCATIAKANGFQEFVISSQGEQIPLRCLLSHLQTSIYFFDR